MNLIEQEPPPAGNRCDGVLAEWNDSRGFGWVEVEGKRRFAHIRDFGKRSRRPKSGDEVSFLPGKDAKGRDCATHIEFKSGSAAGSRLGFGNSLILGALVILPVISGLKLPSAPWIVAAWLLMASRMSWLQYSFDKERAEAGMNRIKELTLLMGDLVGGWPGGFIAQRKLRHKTRKWSYQLRYWAIVALWQILAFEVCMDGMLIKLIKGS